MWAAGDLSLAFPFFPPILDSALRTECFSRNSHLPALKYSLSPLSSFSSTPLWFCHLCSFSCDKQRKRLNIQILLTRAKIYLFFTDVDSFNICRQPSFSKLVLASFSLLNHCVDGPTPTCWGLEIIWVHIKVLRRWLVHICSLIPVHDWCVRSDLYAFLNVSIFQTYGFFAQLPAHAFHLFPNRTITIIVFLFLHTMIRSKFTH